MTIDTFHVLIPMAGEGSRFGYTFKPFLKLDDRLFLEHVLDPFLFFNHLILTYSFIITQDQEDTYSVSKTIIDLFPEIKHKLKFFIIPHKTNGPYQTIINALNEHFIENVFICDCDHQIMIEPMIRLLQSSIHTPDILIPIWNIEPDEQHNWGKVVLKHNKIISFYEKEIVNVNQDETLYGIIGCYFFKHSKLLCYDKPFVNITDFLKNDLLKHQESRLFLQTCQIKDAFFFGTPEMVNHYIKQKRCHENIICDIDGVLFYHNPHSTTIPENNILIGNCVEKLKYWKNKHKKIILMTSRSKKTRKEFIQLLDEKQIIYDELVMGLNPGTRYVINDIKPSNIFTKQAVELNLIRNTGIDHIQCSEHLNNKFNIVRTFKGGSFCSTYLMKINDIYFVRKHIIKTKDKMEHYLKLKRQCEDLRRFYYFNSNLVPNVLNEVDSQHDYYYDMEYFHHYEQLNTFSPNIQRKICTKLLDIMKNDIYVYQKPISGNYFIDQFFKEKIYPKLDSYSNYSPIFHNLIHSKKITINNNKYFGLNNILDILNIYKFSPNFICPIHGDLNFENIIYNENLNDFKIIDMEGSRYVDSPFFDLGKLFQSLISKYEIWSKLPPDQLIFSIDENQITCSNMFFHYDNDEINFVINSFMKIFHLYNPKHIIHHGIFYMTTYFIRFIPFTKQISEKHAYFSMIMAIVWLNKLYVEMNESI